MKKILLCILVFMMAITCYSYEPTHPDFYFMDYINQIENIINGKFENSGNRTSYVVMEYSGENSEILDINDGNIRNLYLVENSELKILSENKKENYEKIRQLMNIKGSYLHIAVVYFKTVGNKIYMAFDDVDLCIRYWATADIINDESGKRISNLPELFDNYDYYKSGSEIYDKWKNSSHKNERG